jgi:hypothetical protein
VADHDVQRLHELGQRKNLPRGKQVTGTSDLAGNTTTTRSSISPSGITPKSGASGRRFPARSGHRLGISLSGSMNGLRTVTPRWRPVGVSTSNSWPSGSASPAGSIA